jgi:hypothetical protein
MGSKSDQLLQLTGFAVHLRSRVTAADQGRRNRSRSPAPTGGTIDPRPDKSALPAVGDLGEIDAATETKLRWRASARRKDSHVFVRGVVFLLCPVVALQAD